MGGKDNVEYKQNKILTKTKLAYIGLFVDGNLTSVGAVVCAWIQVVHKNSLVFFGSSATGELEITA